MAVKVRESRLASPFWQSRLASPFWQQRQARFAHVCVVVTRPTVFWRSHERLRDTAGRLGRQAVHYSEGHRLRTLYSTELRPATGVLADRSRDESRQLTIASHMLCRGTFCWFPHMTQPDHTGAWHSRTPATPATPPCTPWCRRVELHLQRPAPALPLAVRDAPQIRIFSLVGRCPTPPLIFIQVRLAVRDLQPARCSPRSNAAYACHARVRLAPARVRHRHRGLPPELYSSLNEAVVPL